MLTTLNKAKDNQWFPSPRENKKPVLYKTLCEIFFSKVCANSLGHITHSEIELSETETNYKTETTRTT